MSLEKSIVGTHRSSLEFTTETHQAVNHKYIIRIQIKNILKTRRTQVMFLNIKESG
jgi:hypothetical protein